MMSKEIRKTVLDDGTVQYDLSLSILSALIECPTCRQDIVIWPDDEVQIEETAKAMRLARAAPDLLAACVRVEQVLSDIYFNGAVDVDIPAEANILLDAIARATSPTDNP